MQALKLYREKKVGKIILCGGPSTLNASDSIEPQRLKKFLILLGTEPKDLLLEDASRNTHENAVNMKAVADYYFPNKTLLLVTSGWHMRRAAACFAKEGIKVIPYSTDRYGGPAKYEFDYLFLPSSSTLFNWEKLTHEWFGCIVYRLRGYL
jgi:uncharacterized SAM-binding protein YcdF (DUF218 family)